METIFSCYFENIFEELPRGSLLSRQKRRELVEYFSMIIDAYVVTGECSREEGCAGVVNMAVDYHKNTKEGNSNVCLLGKFHDILYVAMKLSFNYSLNDSTIICRLLKEIFDCERTFERIFAGAIFGVRVSHFIAGWKSDFENQEENVAALIFFLGHATKNKLKFRIGDSTKRFLDVPMTSVSNATPLRVAIQIPRPEIVLLLLQFGSAIKFDQGDGSSSSPLEPLIKQLSESEVYSPSCLDCLKILLRALPTIGYMPPKEPEPENYEDFEMLCLQKRLIADNVVPLARCGITPPELKHLCRCAIRQAMWCHWQLPFGIQCLPLPPSLLRYINLLED